MGKTYDLSVLFRVIDKATRPVKRVGKSFNRVISPVKKLNVSLSRTSARLRMLDSAFAKVERRMARSGFTRMGKRMKDVGKDLSLKLTLPIALLGGVAAKSAISFESAFTGVRKTVNATEEEFMALKKSLMGMALTLPLATEEIFGIAEAAGQLGIQKKDIVAFTKVMADLGATTNLTAQEAATNLARFANVTAMSQKDFDRLGSTIVDLGNNMATTEAEIVEMGMRLAGAGKTIGLLPPQIMGLAAALSSVGIRAEAGGTAFSQVMRKIDKEIGTGSKKLRDFALISGKTVAEFEKAWEEDAAVAIVGFTEGLARVQEEGANVNIVLDELGFQGLRLSDALLRASGSGDLMREALELGNKAWKENNALSKEAALRYKTAASQLAMAREGARQMAVAFGAVLVPAILKLLKFLEPVVDWLKKLSPTTKMVIIVIAALAAVIGPLLIALGLIASGIGVIVAVGIPLIATIGLIVAALVAWGTAIQQVVENWDFLIQELKGLAKYLPDFVKKKLGIKTEVEVAGPSKTKEEQETAFEAAKRMARTVGKSETDINIKLTADEGTSATVEKVRRKKGDAAVQVATIGYVGVHP